MNPIETKIISYMDEREETNHYISAQEIIDLVGLSGYIKLEDKKLIEFVYMNNIDMPYYTVVNYRPNHYAFLRNKEFSHYRRFQKMFGDVFIYHIKNDFGLYCVYEHEHHSFDTARNDNILFYGSKERVNEWLLKCVQHKKIEVEK